MKKFKSLNRAIKRGHVAVQVDKDLITGGIKGIYFTRKTSTGKFAHRSASQSNVVYSI